MSKKMTSVSAQVEDLEKKISHLESIEDLTKKVLGQLLYSIYGISVSDLKKLLKNNGITESEFEKKLIQFYNLRSPEEKQLFCKIMCSENSKKYYQTRLKEITNNVRPEKH